MLESLLRTTVKSVKEPSATLADNTKARELLGWKPTQNFETWVTNWKKEIGL